MSGRAGFSVLLAWRSLVKRPWNSVAVLLTLASALGAHGAIAGLWSVVVRPDLPWAEPSRLVNIEVTGMREPLPGMEHLFGTERAALREETESFERVGHWLPSEMTLGEDGTGVARVAIVSVGLFDALGARVAAGRLFLPEDHVPRGPRPLLPLATDFGEPVAVLGHRIALRLGFFPDADGDAEIVLDGSRFRVIGVMPEAFFFPSRDYELWLPEADRPPPPPDRMRMTAATVGRLRPGVSAPAAEDEANAILGRLDLREEGERIELIPIQEDLTRPVRGTLLVLRLGAWLLVLAAVASVIGLSLSRSAAQSADADVRRFVGATPADEVRVLLARWAILALGAGVGALLVGHFVGRFAAPMLGPLAGLDASNLRIAWPEALEVGGAVLLAAGLTEFIGARRASSRRGTLGFLGGGVAVATLTLVATSSLAGTAWGLLEGMGSYPGRGFAQLRVGFEHGGIGLTPVEQGQLMEQLARRVELLPEVEATAWADEMPDALSGRTVSASAPPGFEEPDFRFRVRSVGPGFLELLGIPILGGRGLLPGDDPPAAPVVLVDQSAAHWFGIGDLVRLQAEAAPEIVGVVPAIGAFPAGRPQPTMYQPFGVSRQPFFPRSRAVLAVRFRDSVEPEDLARLAELPAATDPALRALRVESVRQYRERRLGGPLLGAVALGVFAICGVLLALVGAIGQIADHAKRSARSVAIRQAIGAPPDLVVWELTRRALFAALGGVLIGGFGGWLVLRWLSGQVVWLGEADPATFYGPMALLLLLVGIASGIAAFRASRAEPWPKLGS